MRAPMPVLQGINIEMLIQTTTLYLNIDMNVIVHIISCYPFTVNLILYRQAMILRQK